MLFKTMKNKETKLIEIININHNYLKKSSKYINFNQS